MRNTTASLTRTALCLTTLLAALTTSLSAQAADTLFLTPKDSTVAPGSTFDIQVRGAAFQTLQGGGFNLAWNPSVLHLDGVGIAPEWEFAPLGGLIDNASGTLSDAAFTTFNNPHGGDFAAATLHFSAIGVGTTTVSLAPSASMVFSDNLGNVVTPSFAGATVSSVPEPDSLSLLFAGLGILAGVVRLKGGQRHV